MHFAHRVHCIESVTDSFPSWIASMPKAMCLYLDDSGTRNPDKIAGDFIYRDWFTLGGFLVNEEHESLVRTSYDKFRESWKVTYPLRSYDIRLAAARFS